MSYLKLLNARRRSGDQPTMTANRLSSGQKARAAEGICIECGTTRAAEHSYLCTDCEGAETIDDIRQDIAALRRKILNKSED